MSHVVSLMIHVVTIGLIGPPTHHLTPGPPLVSIVVSMDASPPLAVYPSLVLYESLLDGSSHHLWGLWYH